MNKNKKWLVAVSVAAMITANGLALAAANTDKPEAAGGKRPPFAAKGDFKDRMQAFDESKTKLLELLKIDEETFRSEMKAGKTLVAVASEHGVTEPQLKSFIIGQITPRLDESLKSGKISAEQADKMKAEMDERVTDMINGKGPMHKGEGQRPGQGPMDNSKLLALLKVDAETFKSEMKAGKTLVAVANEHGVTETQLKAFFTEQMTQRLDEGLKSGKISTEQANKMKAGMDGRVTDMINGKGPMHKGEGQQHGQRPMDNSKLLALLKVDAETLKSEMKAGKTLVAVANAHGVTEAQLKAFFTEQMTQRLDEGLKSGKITAEQAKKMKAEMDNRVTDMINGQGPMHKDHDRKPGKAELGQNV